MTSVSIRPDMTMEAILERIPSAQRALFQRYHVGGCSACGFQPTDTLAQVCKDHNILDVNEVLEHLQRAHELDQEMQVDPGLVRDWLAAGEELHFIDVRQAAEQAADPVAAAEPLDYNDSGRYMQLPKESKLVFACQDGDRALDVAAYFAGHGFTSVYSLRGGLDAWKQAEKAS